MTEYHNYNTLVLSGGGLKGILMLGSLQYLFDNKIIERKRLTKFIGTSVGAIINVLLIIGFEPKEIIAHIIKKKIFEQLKFTFSGFSLSGTNGLLDFVIIENVIKSFFEMKKKTTIPTIREFCDEYKISFVAVSFNHSKKEEFTISTKHSPDLNLLDALRMTSNVPFVFEPFEYKNELYFDGFLTNNYPINKLDVNHDNAIGIHCDSDKTHDKTKTQMRDISKLKFMWDILLIPLNELQKLKINTYYNELKNINLRTSSSKIYEWDYNLITVKKILDSYSDGYLQTEKLI
jgi:predicted acylesterase/phospholipase RssA